MPDLREQLQNCFQGRVCLMALGNVDYGDDGFGVRLAEKLLIGDRHTIVVAGTAPERVVGWVAERAFDHLIFVDAVEFGSAPGSVVFLNSDQMEALFPQISTHKVALSLLAKWTEANGTTKTWLLGAQPESVSPGSGLSPSVRATLDALRELLQDLSREVFA